LDFKDTNQVGFEDYMKTYLSTFNKDVDYIVWGCGNAYKLFMRAIGDVVKIRYIVDSDKSKQGKKQDRIEIESPRSLNYENRETTRIIIVPTGDMADQIINELSGMGFDESNYCFANDLMIAFNYHYLKRIVIPIASICITTKCTLNCRGCNEYIPYLKKKSNISTATIKRDIDLLFSRVDFCGEIAFSAGENLLNDELAYIIDYIHGKYRDRYSRMFCNTNGTILIKPDLLESIKSANCQIRISRYSVSSKIEPVIRLLDQNHVDYLINESFSFGDQKKGTWFDFGHPLVPRSRSIEENRIHFRNCQLYCRMLHNQVFYYCPTQFGATVGDLYDSNRTNDVLRLAEANRTEIVSFFLSYNAYGYINFCDRCDGMGSAINKNTIPAGTQMSKDEIEKVQLYGTLQACSRE
jgi:hypothetical protein